jgi:predicted TPR repeat methyltransferase
MISGLVQDIRQKIDQVIENTKQNRDPTPGLELLLSSVELMKDMTPGVAVDFGAGGGQDTRTLTDNGWHVHAVDINPNVVNALAAETDTGNVNVHITGDMRNLPLSEKSVSLVNAQRVLPFLSGDEQRTMLAETARILQPSGFLCASFFGVDHSWNKANANCRFMTETQISDALQEAGLELVAIHHDTSAGVSATGHRIANGDEWRIVARTCSEENDM